MDRLDIGVISVCGPLLAYEWTQWHAQGAVFTAVAFFVLILGFVKFGILPDLKVLSCHHAS